MIDPSIKVGDRVEIVQYDRYGSSDPDSDEYNGRVATVLRLDPSDETDPYKVSLDDGGDIWVHNVRRPDAPTATPSRSDYVTQAKAALVGTQHYAADIIELAKFLAGE